jgi:hypothetical protein
LLRRADGRYLRCVTVLGQSKWHKRNRTNIHHLNGTQFRLIVPAGQSLFLVVGRRNPDISLAFDLDTQRKKGRVTGAQRSLLVGIRWDDELRWQ